MENNRYIANSSRPLDMLIELIAEIEVEKYLKEIDSRKQEIGHENSDLRQI